jgi:DNA helicase-2/ATP-dependent DNA helicase PcrA
VRDGLNAAQLQAVDHGDGPLLVVAGAGTGKTMTLACRVAGLIERGVPPQRILLLTFTRRAAREMLSRADRLLGRTATGRAWGGTFHAVGNRLLRRYGRPLGVRPDFTVMDQGDAADLMNLIRGELGMGAGERRFPKKDTLAAVYSRTVNSGLKVGVVVERHFPWCLDATEGIRSIFRSYVERKRRQNVLDYDDLLLYWRALVDVPEAGDRLGDLFDHILVDEYQDTNALQAAILAGMRRRCANITVVGDDAQAIYSFRSATVRNILEFPSAFPDARVLKLEQNYRSTRPVLEVSNAVIAISPQRHEKTLWSDRMGGRRPVLATCLDEPEQSDLVCRRVLEHREQGVALKRQAVLFRAAHHSDLLEVELTRRNIPFVKYGGLRFLEAAHVKDVLAILRVLENPRDEVAWFRVLQLLEGIGPASARRLMEALAVRHLGPDGGSPLSRMRAVAAAVPITARGGFAELRSAFEDCSNGDLPVAAQVERVRGFCEPVFERLYPESSSRIRDVEQLEQLAARSPSRARFLSDLALDPPSSTEDLAGAPLLDEDYLILSTIHSAKGCEWAIVHVIHAADGMIPSDLATGDQEQIEEERRLLYVALTRARDALHVYFPLRYYRRPGLQDSHGFAQLTRFLPEEVRSLFDRDGSAVEPAEVQPATASVDRRAASHRVEEYLGALWDE